MRFFKFYFLIIVFLTSLLFSLTPEVFSYYPEKEKPQRLVVAREQYIRDSLSTEDREFLKGLQEALKTQSQMNLAVSNIFSSVPGRDDVHRGITKHLHNSSKIAMNEAFGGDPVKGVVDFATAFMKVAGPFVSLVYDMGKFLKATSDIKNEFGEAVQVAQSYSGYDSAKWRFKQDVNMYPYEVIKEASVKFGIASVESSPAVRIKEMKEELEDIAIYSDRMLKAFKRHFGSYVVSETGAVKLWKINRELDKINDELSSPNLSNPNIAADIARKASLLGRKIQLEIDAQKIKDEGNWFRWAVETAVTVTVKQLEANKRFCDGIMPRVNQIKIPDEPKMPDFEVASIEVFPMRDEKGQEKKKDELLIGDKVKIIAEVKNSGQFKSDPTVVRINPYTKGENSERTVPALGPGEIHKIEWEYTLVKANNIFTATVNPDQETWEDDDYYDVRSKKWENKKQAVFNLKAASDLNVEFVEIPSNIYKDEKIKITVRVGNEGNVASTGARVELSANRVLIARKEIGNIERKQNVDVKFDWQPKEKGDYILDCRLYAKGEDKNFGKKDNAASRSVKVILHQQGWSLVKDSLIIKPAKPTVGEEASIYFAVSNTGQNTSTKAQVYIDDKLIKSIPINVESESKAAIGDSAQDKLTWKVLGGRHKIKVELDTKDSGGTAVLQKTLGVQTLMPTVAGTDLVLDKKFLSYKDGKVTIKVYNRGDQPSKMTQIKFAKFPSRMKEPDSVIHKDISGIQSHELKTITADIFLRDSKLVVTVDSAQLVSEADEKNNEVEIVKGSYRAYEPPREIRAEGPDLTVADIVNLDTPLSVDETRQVTIVIANHNIVDAKSVKVNYEFWNLAVNDVTASHGYKKGSKSFSKVPKEGTASFSVNYKGVYPADYRLTVQVDPQGEVKETDEYNNTSERYFNVGGEVTSQMFFSGKDVDLSIDSDIQISNTEPPAGMSVNFDVTVHNYSKMEVWGADLDMFVEGELVDGQALGTLPSESTRELSFNYAFPKSGSHKVEFMIDAKEVVPEKNERNNTATATLEVKPGLLGGTGHVDVSVASFSLNKTTCMQGELVTAKVTIKNTGQDILYGVLATIGPSGNKPVYIKIFPILDPGEEAEISTTLPVFIPGEHIIEARVDGKNIIQEEDEDNNIMGVTLVVEKVTREGVKEELKQKTTGVVVEKANKVVDAVNRWLKGLGKPRQ